MLYFILNNFQIIFLGPENNPVHTLEKGQPKRMFS